MTVHMDWQDQGVRLHVEGDIYEEQAECLCDLIRSHIRHGTRELNILLYTTYYISLKGQQCLQCLCDEPGCRNVKLFFQCPNEKLNFLHRCRH